ncbi:MAG: hypothetical protein EOO53_14290 [Gammaproteobacteria bacterium]|nr:MAG: hypothetical protein EOO53_14290 [Gammaproteobacteria bacterium]
MKDKYTYQNLLRNVIGYKNQNVIISFTQKYDVDVETATIIFEDMIRFLTLSRLDDESLCVIDDPILIIDEMWHLFILSTQDYFLFCKSFFGEYIHHKPTIKKPEKSRNQGITLQFIEKKRKRYLALYNILGVEVFDRWFHFYASEFSKNKISGLRRY